MFEQIFSLPVEKKIGQLFFIGIGGADLTDETDNLLREISPGGVCLFSRNIKTAEQTRGLLSDIRNILEIEPFLSLDEEGGVVDRLRRIVTPLPAANSIKSAEDARAFAEITANILLTLGFNMNFAPVVDVGGGERSKFSNGLYSRAFGDDKESVALLTKCYLHSLQLFGCVGCLKHFPGLGASVVDSHERLPSVQISSAEFAEVDLFPYRQLFKSEIVHAVMVAHAAYPQIELQEIDSSGKLLPSSLSYNFVTKLLREQLNFDALTITDDLEMGAIVNDYGVGDACVRAIDAGVDMPAVCAGVENVRAGFYAVLKAVKNKEISEDRIDQSLRRIARVKNFLRKPHSFDAGELRLLSDKISRLNEKLNYSYGG